MTTPGPSLPSPPPRRTGRVVGSLAALVLAPLSWWLTIDQPWLRASGASAWALLALALGLACSAAWRDRRRWVRGVALAELGLAALSVWAFFGLAGLPATGLPGRAVDFTLVDQDLRPTTLSAELARGPVLLVFFRGPW